MFADPRHRLRSAGWIAVTIDDDQEKILMRIVINDLTYETLVERLSRPPQAGFGEDRDSGLFPEIGEKRL